MNILKLLHFSPTKPEEHHSSRNYYRVLLREIEHGPYHIYKLANWLILGDSVSVSAREIGVFTNLNISILNSL
jgi:hypothetical protein